MRALRRAIASGHRTTLGTIRDSVAHSFGRSGGATAVVESVPFFERLPALEKRRARRVADALHSAEFGPAEARAILLALFAQPPTEGQLRAAFATFDRDGTGASLADCMPH